MHVKNNDMYPMTRQKLPSGETMLSFPSPLDSGAVSAPTTISAASTASNFKMVMNKNDRMAGSVPVWNSASITDASDGAATKDEDFGFKDFIDIINPLQHIPIIAQLYRAITDDVISPVAEVIGGGLFGGPVGAATGAASAAFSGQVGDDLKQAFSGIFSSDKNDIDTTIAITNLSDNSRYNQ